MTSPESDAAAFREVFERHHVEIRRYLRHRVADAELAEDLAAETFARAFAARLAGADPELAAALATLRPDQLEVLLLVPGRSSPTTRSPSLSGCRAAPCARVCRALARGYAPSSAILPHPLSCFPRPETSPS